MKILVFSDSHRNVSNINKALEEHSNTAELIICLGDGADDLYHAKSFCNDVPKVIVAGNYEDAVCGADSKLPAEIELELDGVRVLCAHGHRRFVKRGLDIIANKAAADNIDLVLFGHTHSPLDETIDINNKKIKLFNPGSIGRGSNPSYGIVNIINGVIVTSHRFMNK